MSDKQPDEDKQAGSSYIPSLSSITGTASAGVGKAQDGVAAGGSGVQTLTGNIPVVGKITEGVGNAPLAQKIAGTEQEEEKGYLAQAYDYAGGAVKVVYDAAGNAVGYVGETASTYLNKDGQPTDKPPAAQEGKSEDEVKQQEGLLKQAEHDAGTKSNDQQTSTEAAGDAAKGASDKYSETTEQLKQAHRGAEDTAQKGIHDAVGKVQDGTGTKESTQSAVDGFDKTVDSAKGTTRQVEDKTQKTAENVAGAVTADDGKGYTEKAGNAAGEAGQGAKDVASGAPEAAGGLAGGVKDTGVGLGQGVSSGVGAVGSGLGSVTGLGGSSEEK